MENMNKEFVNIILPVFDNLLFTKQFMNSLYQNTRYPFYLIVIDNGSKKETQLYLEEEKNKGRINILIRNEKNLGFPKAINQGYLKSKESSFILIVNNDVIFPYRWLERLVKVAQQDHKIAIVSPLRLLKSPEQNKLQIMKEQLKGIEDFPVYDFNDNDKNLKEKVELFNLNLRDSSARDKYFIIEQMVPFFCVLIRKKYFEEIGGLDEDFGLGMYDDTYFCYLVREKKLKIAISIDTFVYHYMYKTSMKVFGKDFNKQIEKNAEIMHKKISELDNRKDFLSPNKELVISLLMYNNPEPEKIIRDIIKTTKSDFKLIITDNASDIKYRNKLEKLKEELKDDSDRVKFYFNKENEGYIAVHNKVAKELKEEFLCILNDDLYFREIGWDLKCREEFKKNTNLAEIGLIGIDTFSCLNSEGCGTSGDEVEFVQGSFIFIPLKIVKEIIDNRGSLLSTEYDFIYAEDSDLSLTVRQKGYDIKLINLDIKHEKFEREVNDKLGGGRYYDKKNRKIFCKKWSWYLKNRKFEKTILLKRERGYGDLLFLTPFIDAIKRKNPAYKIYLKTACPQALKNNPQIEKIYDMGKDESEFNEIYNFEYVYEKTPSRPILDSFLEILNIPIERKLFFYPSLVSSFSWDTRKKKIYIDDTVSWGIRNWGKWDDLIPLLNEYDVKKTSDFSGLSLTEFGYILSQADLFVGIDNVWFHMSQALGLKSVTIWGGTSPEYRATNFDIATFIRSNLGCLGCHHRAPAPCYYSDCSKESKYRCLKVISPIMVKNVIDEVLNK